MIEGVKSMATGFWVLVLSETKMTVYSHELYNSLIKQTLTQHMNTPNLCFFDFEVARDSFLESIIIPLPSLFMLGNQRKWKIDR
jgi:hypothetical protein